jgi:choline-phosphate cytidylyltransferase
MKKVLVFGTFDIFHEGHRNFLKQAREYGDFLRVVVARDKTVSFVKKHETKDNEQIRKRNIEESGLADNVVLGSLGDKYEVIKEFQPDVICLGYDQEFFIEKLQEKLLEFGLEKTEIVRLKPYKPELYKSSLLRKH